MEQGTIIKWRIQPGTCVKQGEILFEVETDKAVVEVEAVHSGRLSRIVVNEGESIAVKEPVAYLADSDAAVDAYLAGKKGSASAKAEEPMPQNTDSSEILEPLSHLDVSNTATEPVKASPAARKCAAERQIDLTALKPGRGPGGRVLSTDVLGARPESYDPRISQSAGGPVRKRLSKMRKAIAGNLQLSKQTIPHFYMRMTFNAGPMLDFFKEQKAKYSCGINDMLIAACARVIFQFPAFRSRIENEEFVEVREVNIGVAVSLEEGLTVPVLVGAERMSLEQIATNTRRIVESARAGKLEGSGQGVFTISNMGMFGVEEFSAIINPPEAAILAVGAARETMIVKDGAARIGWLMTVTLSCDHRIIDGVMAAQFLAQLKQILEAPAQLIHNAEVARPAN